MIINEFFTSYAGMYVAQSFCHSITASIITSQALKAWNINDPAIRQRFHFLVVLIPIFSFPLYQIFNHDRSLLQFRMEALFDINRWMALEIRGVFPAGLLFLVMLAITSLAFIFQEMVPVLAHAFDKKEDEQDLRHETDPFVESASKTLSIVVPRVVVIADEDAFIYSTTGKDPSIFVSDGLIQAVSPDQLQAALAHELGHIARSRRPLLLITFIFRIILFFNPVTLIEFRRAVRSEEMICDDIAVSLTNRPEVLKDTLRQFIPAPKPPDPGAGKKIFSPAPLEEQSHVLQIESRIARLGGPVPEQRSGRWILFACTILLIMSINYYIV